MQRPLLLALASLAVLAASACRSARSDGDIERHERVRSLAPTDLGEMAVSSQSGDLTIGSQPSLADLDTARRRMIETVVCLRGRDEAQGFDAERACATLGMRYVQIGVDVEAEAEAAQDEAVDAVLAELRRPDRGATLLYCQSGNRSAALFAIYSAVVAGVPLEAALYEARLAGMKPGRTEDFVREQVQRLETRA